MRLNCLSPIWKKRWFRSVPLNCNLCGCAEIRWIHPGYPRWVQIMFQKSGGNKTPTWLAAVKLVAKPFPAVWTWALFEMSCVATHAILQPRITAMNSHQARCKFSGCPTSCRGCQHIEISNTWLVGHMLDDGRAYFSKSTTHVVWGIHCPETIETIQIETARVVVKKWSMKLVKNCRHLHKFCECPVRQFGAAFLRHFFIIRPDQLTYTATKHLFQRKVIFQPPVWQILC